MVYQSDNKHSQNKFNKFMDQIWYSFRKDACSVPCIFNTVANLCSVTDSEDEVQILSNLL